REATEVADELQELARCGEGGVRGRGDAVLECGDAADLRDLLRDLGGRQDAAQSRLRTLRELEGDELDLRQERLLPEGLRREVPVRGATAEVAAAELPADVRAAVQVELREPAFAGLVEESALRRTGAH